MPLKGPRTNTPGTPRRLWTPEERDTLLRLFLARTPITQIAATLSRSYAATDYALQKLRAEGRLAKRYYRWSKADTYFIKLMISTNSTPEAMAEEFDRTPAQIRDKLQHIKRMKLRAENALRKECEAAGDMAPPLSNKTIPPHQPY